MLRRMKAYFPKALAVVVGTLVLAASSSASAIPLYEVHQNALDSQGCNGTGCWSNHVRLADLNNDGYYDIIEPNYSGFFQQGQPQPLLIYFNDGNADFDAGSDSIGDFNGRIRQVAIGDIDGDGYLDIYAPDGWGGQGGMADALFINQGDGTFVDEGDARLPAQQYFAGAARFGDLDGDGDLDLLVADGYGQGSKDDAYGVVMLNDGDGYFDVGGSVPSGGVGFDPDDIDLIDIDRDFDLDVLINMHAGKSSLWENDGAANFTDITDQWVDQPAQGFHYNPGVCDVDGDGDLDVWTDNMGPGYTEQLAINDGNGNFTDETADRVAGNFGGADDNGVSCADMDGDGDFDAVVYNLFTQGGDPRVERILYNAGDGTFGGSPSWDEFPNTSDATLWGEAVDLNDDRRLDFVTAQGEQAGPLRVYRALDEMPQDVLAPVIIASQEVEGSVFPDSEPVVRYAVSDEVVSDMGPRLDRAWVEVTIGGDLSEVEAWFVGGDLFMARLEAQPAGTTVEYKLCALDRANNSACTDAFEYIVEEDNTDDTADTGDTDDTSDDTTSGSEGETDGETSAGATGDDEVGETAGDAMADEDGGSGCNCSTAPEPGAPRGGRGWLGLFGLIALFGVRRYRRGA